LEERGSGGPGPAEVGPPKPSKWRRFYPVGKQKEEKEGGGDVGRGEYISNEQVTCRQIPL